MHHVLLALACHAFGVGCAKKPPIVVLPTPTVTTVTCPVNVTATGQALEPCTAVVTGTAVQLAVPVTYANNIDPGTARASATYSGDATHVASAGYASFMIIAAPPPPPAPEPTPVPPAPVEPAPAPAPVEPPAPTTEPPAPAPTPSSVVQAPDLVPLGAFRVPTSITGYAPATIASANLGLTVRYVNNQRHFLLLTQPGNVLEFADPGASLTAYPQVASALTYPAPFSPLHNATGRCGVDDAESCSMKGIYWDERGQRLYGAYGDNYGPPNQSAMPSLSAVTLNAATATSSLVGYWTVGTAGYKAAQSGVGQLADGRLVAGWGGNASIASSGGTSFGISAQVFTAPTTSTGTIPTQTLVSYPFTAGCGARMVRPLLDPPLDQHLDTCGNTVTAWGDVFGGCAFVSTASKAGLVCLADLVKGYHNYWSSTEVGMGAEHRLLVFDPAHLDQPVANTPFRVPDENYTQFPYTVTPIAATSVTRTGGVYSFTAANHGIDPRWPAVAHITGSVTGDLSLHVQDANTLQACANGGNANVVDVGGCAAMAGSATLGPATLTQMWMDTTGYNQLLAITYDSRAQDVFILMSLPYQGYNTFTVYRFHLN